MWMRIHSTAVATSPQDAALAIYNVVVPRPRDVVEVVLAAEHAEEPVPLIGDQHDLGRERVPRRIQEDAVECNVVVQEFGFERGGSVRKATS